MECADCKEKIALLIADSLDEFQRHEIETHLEGCPDCRAEWETSRKLWDLMGEIPQPVPPETIRSRFTIALSDYTREVTAAKKKTTLPNFFSRSWFFQPRFQLGYGILLISIGFLGGYLLSHGRQHSSSAQYSRAENPETHQSPDETNPNPTRESDTETITRLQTTPSPEGSNSSQPSRPINPSINRQIDSLSAQVSEMKQMMMLSMLENPSASQRIKAVSYSDEIGSANKKVIDALFTTLNEDPNVNVRLITLDALAKFAKDPAVREGLIQSIAEQESPLLQSAIADVMVKLQEKRSIKPLEKLLQKKDINEMVKQKIEQSIQKLI